ncbi:hypothetical protein [Limosilactobacillus reuteri]|uniref:hypothetical protein n=1 Tax=Limosilactobacillus reuteri TaxID=1598 RepID=UPI00129A8BF7|nr:hypothetical protein [Limosilactobacillus reuteri]MRI08788.1 hypothetical protein [Limosilactobacillus reuteri]
MRLKVGVPVFNLKNENSSNQKSQKSTTVNHNTRAEERRVGEDCDCVGKFERVVGQVGEEDRKLVKWAEGG